MRYLSSILAAALALILTLAPLTFAQAPEMEHSALAPVAQPPAR